MGHNGMLGSNSLTCSSPQLFYCVRLIFAVSGKQTQHLARDGLGKQSAAELRHLARRLRFTLSNSISWCLLEK